MRNSTDTGRLGLRLTRRVISQFSGVRVLSQAASANFEHKFWKLVCISAVVVRHQVRSGRAQVQSVRVHDAFLVVDLFVAPAQLKSTVDVVICVKSDLLHRDTSNSRPLPRFMLWHRGELTGCSDFAWVCCPPRGVPVVLVRVLLNRRGCDIRLLQSLWGTLSLSQNQSKMSNPTEITADTTGLPEDVWTLQGTPSECQPTYHHLIDEERK